jgi:hypothetical protein
MEHKYRSHTIVITSWGSLDPDGFRPELRISKKTPILFQSLKINQTFPTREEAEDYALQVAKKWIDDSKSSEGDIAAKSETAPG